MAIDSTLFSAHPICKGRPCFVKPKIISWGMACRRGFVCHAICFTNVLGEFLFVNRGGGAKTIAPPTGSGETLLLLIPVALVCSRFETDETKINCLIEGIMLHCTQMAAETFDRITLEPGKLNGQPCIRGMRLTVKRVLALISLYPNRAELFGEYPELEEEDIQQALRYAQLLVEDKNLPLISA
jgi:uncharacterized protein (DUF433 family)